MPRDPAAPEPPTAEPASLEPGAALWLAEEWGRQITRAVESMTGESALVTFAPRVLAPAEIDPQQNEWLWWEQPLNLGAGARIWVGAAAGTSQDIGNRVLRSAGVDDATAEDIRSTYLEIVNQSLSGVASAITARIRKEVACVEGQSLPPTLAPGLNAYAFELTLGEQNFSLLAVFSHALAEAAETPGQTAPAAAPPASAPGAPAPKPAAPGSAPGSIDLLLDVELPVSVSFGRAQLMLKDVLKLTTGSIVELNRSLSEPVEVIVNNCVIARGEVVVVEGNYGIRIKQVISRQERLRTLY
jgi:flagellar motor switch protein FliN